MEDIETMRVATIDAVTEQMENVIESIRHNGHLIHCRHVDIVNATSTIRSRNSDIAQLLKSNGVLNEKLGTLQSILEKESRYGCDR